MTGMHGDCGPECQFDIETDSAERARRPVRRGGTTYLLISFIADEIEKWVLR